MASLKVYCDADGKTLPSGLHLGEPPRLYNFMDGTDGLAGGAGAPSRNRA